MKTSKCRCLEYCPPIKSHEKDGLEGVKTTKLVINRVRPFLPVQVDLTSSALCLNIVNIHIDFLLMKNKTEHTFRLPALRGLPLLPTLASRLLFLLVIFIIIVPICVVVPIRSGITVELRSDRTSGLLFASRTEPFALRNCRERRVAAAEMVGVVAL